MTWSDACWCLSRSSSWSAPTCWSAQTWRFLGFALKSEEYAHEKRREKKKPASFSFERICSVVCFCSVFSDSNFRTTGPEASPEIELQEDHTLFIRARRLPLHISVLRVLRPLLTKAYSSLLVPSVFLKYVGQWNSFFQICLSCDKCCPLEVWICWLFNLSIIILQSVLSSC